MVAVPTKPLKKKKQFGALCREAMMVFQRNDDELNTNFNPAAPQPFILEQNKQSSILGKSQDRKAQEAKYFSVE